MAEGYQLQQIGKQLNAALETLKRECSDRKWCADQALSFCLDKAEMDPLKLAADLTAFLTDPITQAQKQIEDFLKGLV